MHLLAAITPHGYGHAAQTGPVLNALRRRLPELRLTVQSTLPRAFLATLIDGPFDHDSRATDFGMHMVSALAVRAEDSAAAYRAQFAAWPAHLAAETAHLAGLAPDLVLADVPYLPLAAAARLGIPAVGLSSLNWAGIYRHYFGARPEAAEVLGPMEAAYNGAAMFLRLTPAMAMPELTNTRPVGPVARLGRDRRGELDRRLDLTPGDRLVVVALGGIPARLPVEDWPRLPGVRWLVPTEWAVRHPDARPLAAAGMPFPDVLRSADALLGKPGYGTVAECACNGVPMLWMARGDWPESPALMDWLAEHGRSLEVPARAVEKGDLWGALQACIDLPAPPLPEPTGADEAAALLAELLRDAAAA